MIEHTYTIHSAAEGEARREVQTADGKTVTAVYKAVTVELVAADRPTTLTIVVPKDEYDLGGVGDAVTVAFAPVKGGKK